MTLRESFEKIYRKMENGHYDELVCDAQTFGLKAAISLEMVERARIDEGVNFNGFIRYAQRRKKRGESDGEY